MKRGKLHYLLGLLVFLAFTSPLKAQNEEKGLRYGGWHFLEISHTFKDAPKWSCMFYLEHENYQYRWLDCCFIRAKVGYKVLPWLKLGLGYDYVGYSTTYGHRLVGDVTGTLKKENLSASVRLRYLHTWKPELASQDNELRTLLRVMYTFPEKTIDKGDRIRTRGAIMPYMAVELFTWGDKWRKSRHYVGCMYNITQQMQIEGFYMLTFSNKDPEHILGLGLNFTI